MTVEGGDRRHAGARQHRHAALAALRRAWRPWVVVGALSATGLDPGRAQPLPAADPGWSDLAQVDRGNVARLAPVFTLGTGAVGAEDGAPVAGPDGLLYVTTPFPHTVLAVDVAAAPASRIRWRRALPADRRADPLACCRRQDHAPRVDGDRLHLSTLDGRVVGLDTASGAIRHDVRVADPRQGESLVAPPLLTPGAQLVVGIAGDDYGVRGRVVALDAATGAVRWTRHTTGPDADVGIGERFASAGTGARGAELGMRTWPADGWQRGGGGVASVQLDPATGLLLHPTGRAAPPNPEQRPGLNRWTGGVFARDPGTGEARWFSAFRAPDPFGFADGIDLLLEGPTPRLVHVDGNGLLYVLDAQSGALQSADSIVPGVVERVDLARGSTAFDPQKAPHMGRQSRGICPSWLGPVGAGGSVVRDGDAQLAVLPLVKVCMDVEPRLANPLPGTPYAGPNVRLHLAPVHAGALVAWDVDRRRVAWQVDERWPVFGAPLATAGGLVFYGTLDGWLKAVDARDGRLLWQAALPGGVVGRPAMLRGRDGRPYLAVVAGSERLFGASRREALDARDAGAARGLSGLMRALPQDRQVEGTLVVFSLP